MRRAVVVLVLVLVVGAAALLVVTSRPELNRTRDAAEASWAPLVKPLDARYAALATLAAETDAALQASGEDGVDRRDLRIAIDRWKAATKADDAEKMVAAANELEARIGRLRAVL